MREVGRNYGAIREVDGGGERVSLTLSDLHRVVTLSHPVVHPDGHGGVVVHKTALPDGSGYCRRLLWVSPQERRFLTGGPSDTAPAFGADGADLWFVRTTDDLGQVYRLPMAGGEAVPVGPRWEGLSQVLPLADGRAVVAARRPVDGARPDPVWPRHYRQWQWHYDGAGFFEEPTRLYLITGAATEVLDDSPYNVANAALPPGGAFVVYTRLADEPAAATERTDLFRAVLTGVPRVERLTHGPVAAGAAAPMDDGTIWFYGDDRRFGPATVGQLYRRTPDGQVVQERFADEWSVGSPLSSDTHVPAGPGGPRLAGRFVYGLATWRGATTIWRRPAGGDGAPEVVGTADPVVYELAAHGEALLYVSASPSSLDAVHYRRAGGEEARLTDDNAWAHGELSPTEEIAAAAADGLTIPAYVTGREPGGKRAAILLVHGGPHGAYGRTPRFDAQVMAQDYTVIQVNPRGSMGYGQAFQNAVRGDWGGADMADLMAVVDLLAAAGDIDGERLYVTGGSYGGFMTSWIVGHTDRFKAASAVVPVTNLVSFYGTSDIGWWFAPGEVGADLWDDPERLWKQSPLAYAPHIRTPTQVMAGEDDQRCPIEQAEQLYVALKHFGVETEFLRYPGPHGFGALSKPTLRQDRLRRLLEWFRSYP